MCGRTAATHSTTRPESRSRSRSGVSGAGGGGGPPPPPGGPPPRRGGGRPPPGPPAQRRLGRGLGSRHLAEPVRHDREAGGIDPERRADLVARRRRHRDQRVGVPRGAPDDLGHAPGRHAAERRRVHEGHVVQGQDGTEPRRPDRAGAGETVEEVGTGSPRVHLHQQLLGELAPEAAVFLGGQRPQAGDVPEAVSAERALAGAGREEVHMQVRVLRRERPHELAQIGLGPPGIPRREEHRVERHALYPGRHAGEA